MLAVPLSFSNIWLPRMDSNHDTQIQNLQCYRYTTRQNSSRTTCVFCCFLRTPQISFQLSAGLKGTGTLLHINQIFPRSSLYFCKPIMKSLLNKDLPRYF